MNQGINGDAHKINNMTKDVSTSKIYFSLASRDILIQDDFSKVNEQIYKVEVEDLKQHTKGSYKG